MFTKSKVHWDLEFEEKGSPYSCETFIIGKNRNKGKVNSLK